MHRAAHRFCAATVLSLSVFKTWPVCRVPPPTRGLFLHLSALEDFSLWRRTDTRGLCLVYSPPRCERASVVKQRALRLDSGWWREIKRQLRKRDKSRRSLSIIIINVHGQAVAKYRLIQTQIHPMLHVTKSDDSMR